MGLSIEVASLKKAIIGELLMMNQFQKSYKNSHTFYP